MMKVILIDFNIYMFRSIFSWYKNKQIPATYATLVMMLGDLRRVGLNKDDIVIMAIDSPLGSWRRQLDKSYKSTRKDFREKFKIDWDYMFKQFNKLLTILDMYTPWHVIQIDYLEADDIISYATKYFSDKDCIIISSDSDYEILTARDNVKIFSPISKRYKHIKDPYKILFDKINKEQTDNLVSDILNERDFDIRCTLVDLLNLPKKIEILVTAKLENLPKKDWDYDKLPYKSLRQRFLDIYKQDKVVSFDYNPKKHKNIKKCKGGKVK